MDERRDSGAQRQTTPADEPPCLCGSRDHEPLRIGERLDATGAALEPVFVCPAQSAAGLRGVL